MAEDAQRTVSDLRCNPLYICPSLIDNPNERYDIDKRTNKLSLRITTSENIHSDWTSILYLPKIMPTTEAADEKIMEF